MRTSAAPMLQGADLSGADLGHAGRPGTDITERTCAERTGRRDPRSRQGRSVLRRRPDLAGGFTPPPPIEDEPDVSGNRRQPADGGGEHRVAEPGVDGARAFTNRSSEIPRPARTNTRSIVTVASMPWAFTGSVTRARRARHRWQRPRAGAICGVPLSMPACSATLRTRTRSSTPMSPRRDQLEGFLRRRLVVEHVDRVLDQRRLAGVERGEFRARSCAPCRLDVLALRLEVFGVLVRRPAAREVLELSAAKSAAVSSSAAAWRRRRWRDDPTSFDGEHYQLDEMRCSPKPAHDIPIWVGGSSEPRVPARRSSGATATRRSG